MTHSLNEDIERFMEYLRVERNASPHTIRNYAADLRQFLQHLSEQHIASGADVTPLHIRGWLSAMLKNGTARKSLARRVSCLRTFFEFVSRDDEQIGNPADKIAIPKLEKRTPKFLYIEEVNHLMEAPSESTLTGIRDRAILEMLYATGVRVSELVQLDLADLNLSLGTALVFGKGRKERIVLLGSKAQFWTERYIKEARAHFASAQETQALFLNTRGNRLTDRSIRRMVDTYIKQVAAHLDISPHGLRHTFATHLLDEGADLRVVQELLGHVSLSSTQIYTHTTKEKLMRVYVSAHPRA